MISLRKAADPRRRDWFLAAPTADGGNLRAMKFPRPPKGPDGTSRSEILLDTLPEPRVVV